MNSIDDTTVYTAIYFPLFATTLRLNTPSPYNTSLPAAPTLRYTPTPLPTPPVPTHYHRYTTHRVVTPTLFALVYAAHAHSCYGHTRLPRVHCVCYTYHTVGYHPRMPATG